MNLLAELKSRFRAALTDFADDPAQWLEMIRPAGDARFGDFQANFAMPLARQRGENPRELAAAVAGKLEVDDLCLPPEVAGPGFINITLRDGKLEELLGEVRSDERLGVPAADSPQTVVIDYSAPNVAKPMHVGHLRSTVLGAALVKLFRFAGHTVIADNHIGDWGTQFGMIIYGYKHFLNEAAYREQPVQELARLYRLVNQLCDYHGLTEKLPKMESALQAKQSQLAEQEEQTDASSKSARKALGRLRTEVKDLQEEIATAQQRREAIEADSQLAAMATAHPDIIVASRQETAGLHSGDEENLKLWQEFLPACLAALDSMYERLDTTFDLTRGESWYQPMLADVVADMEQRGLARESEGATCVFLEGNAAPFIIRKRDGAFTYATTDLATIRSRVEELKADLILYVVDARQSEHFKLLFGTARAWGYDSTEYRHVSFGTILGPDGKPYKTRAGDTVGLESLLDEAVRRAREIVDANDDAKDQPELDESRRAAVAETVGIGGIKYADLHHNRESDYKFDYDKMLAKSGDTATYMQYSYARIAGIFREVGYDPSAATDEAGAFALTDGYTRPYERDLTMQLLRFPEAIDAALSDCRPNLLTQYLFETANSFSRFYDQCHIKRQSDAAIRANWLTLCEVTARVLKQGLDLLGIETCETM